MRSPKRGLTPAKWHPTPVLLPGKSHGWRSLVGCSPWGREELDTTERLQFHFSLSCTGEGNGNPLQYSCLENPRDRGAWWAAVHGVAQNQTRLKRLSSSSSSSSCDISPLSHPKKKGLRELPYEGLCKDRRETACLVGPYSSLHELGSDLCPWSLHSTW